MARPNDRHARRELVGELDRSEGHNPERNDGSETTEGITEAVASLSQSAESDRDDDAVAADPPEGYRPYRAFENSETATDGGAVFADTDHDRNRNAGTVELVITDGCTRFRVREPTPEVDRLLRDALAFEVDGAEFSDAYRDGQWDGQKRLYTSQSAPFGLLDRAGGVLADAGYTVNTTTDDHPGARPETFAWEFPHELRHYQREAVAAVLDAGGGVVSIPTGGGKTVVALRVIHAVGQRAVIVVHTKELLRQWADRIRDVLDVDPGIIGGGEWSRGPVSVAMAQTLTSRGTDELDGVGVLVFDECHRTSAAETYHDVGLAVQAPWRVGLSATPWRTVDGEEMLIEGAVGPVVCEVNAADLIEAGHLARPEFEVIDPADYGRQPTANPGEDYQDAYSRCVVRGGARNRAVADTADRLASDGYSVLVSVARIEHGERLRDRIPGSVFLCGDDGDDRRERVLRELEDGGLQVVVSTLLKEGVDLPGLNAVILAEGRKSDVAKIQTVGRALRPAGGDHAVIADVRDRGEFHGEHYEIRRQAFADYYGKYGPDGSAASATERVRQWLDAEGVPVGKLKIWQDDDGVTWIETDGYLRDFEGYMAVMRDTDAVYYEPESHRNYIRDVAALPAVNGVGVD